MNSGATHQHTSLQISAVFGRSADKHRPVACIPRVTIKVQILKGRETIQEGVRIQEAEQWKDVPGWENLYMVSNTGKVWSQITGKIRKTAFNTDGYEVIMLSRDGKQFGTFVHRLVAMAFLPNPNNYPVVNHKDENPKNNHVDNLEWCSYYYNLTYNNSHKKRAAKRGYDVYQYNHEGKLVGVYPNTRTAAKIVGGSHGNIAASCKHNKGTVKGYVFSYHELSVEDVLQRFAAASCPEKCRSYSTRDSNKNNPSLSKQVAQYDLQMNLLNVFPSAQEAHRQLGYALSGITSTCRGEHKTCHGFIFQYIK